MTRMTIVSALLMGTLIAIALPATAQDRDPAYAAARAAGQIGELPDGYIGVVGTPTRELSALVNKINIQRKAVYTQKSAASGATVEEMAFTTGCNLILKTAPGEKYRDPSGNWQTRTAAAPTRDPRCV
jgi:uncharacterized protein YdbL (DUF1318 family)